jgi:hypothetical protein
MPVAYTEWKSKNKLTQYSDIQRIKSREWAYFRQTKKDWKLFQSLFLTFSPDIIWIRICIKWIRIPSYRYLNVSQLIHEIFFKCNFLQCWCNCSPPVWVYRRSGGSSQTVAMLPQPNRWYAASAEAVCCLGLTYDLQLLANRWYAVSGEQMSCILWLTDYKQLLANRWYAASVEQMICSFCRTDDLQPLQGCYSASD